MRLLLPLLLIFISGCAPVSGRLSARDTGLSGSFSEQVQISSHPHHVLYGHVIEVTRGASPVRALVVSQRRDGIHALRFQEIWSSGVELPFSQTNALNGCSHGNCLNRHAGMVLLSNRLFIHAQAHGLQARMIGGQANIDISVPASLFHLPRQ